MSDDNAVRFITTGLLSAILLVGYAEISVRAYQETSGRNSRDQKQTARKCTGEMEGQPQTTNGGSNDCRRFWTSL